MARPTTLGEFLQMEIENRHLTARKFAQLVGVNHHSINMYLEHGIKENTGNPSPEFLLKLSKATGVNVVTLLALTFPEVGRALEELTQVSSTDALRLEYIEQLPENLRQAVDTIIFERSKNTGDNKNTV